MSHRLDATVPVMLVAAVLAAASSAQADLIRLRNGGEIRGQITREASNDPQQLTIETLSGAVVILDRSEAEFVTRRPLKVEEYETRAKRTPMTVEDQWELAEWCREQALMSQREHHLAKVIELDPDHEKAHYALGHTKHDGVWTTRDELMKSRGYVKYKGRYITPQEMELLEKSEAELAAEQEWYRKVRMWHGWLLRYPDRAQAAVLQLQQIRDADAVAALRKYFADESDKQFRSLYIQVLGQIPGPNSAAALVRQSLVDADYELRYRALDALSPDQHERAMQLFIEELKNGLNPVVERAAIGLQRVGDERVVPELIEALVTTHQYRVTVPETSGNMSFSTDGSFPGTAQPLLPPEVELALRTGQLPYGAIVLKPQMGPVRTRTMTVRKEHRNEQVLAALRKLTGQDFGYDERTWQLWYTAQKSGALGAIKS